MSDKPPKKISAFRKMMDFILASERYKKQKAEFTEFYDYIEATNSPGIRVELPPHQLNEATHAQVGRFTARRDTPHFPGDEYHGHCDVGGGYQVAWTVSGVRRHPTKFPATIPHDARAAVAKVLNVSPDRLLETYWIEIDGDKILLLEYRET